MKLNKSTAIGVPVAVVLIAALVYLSRRKVSAALGIPGSEVTTTIPPRASAAQARAAIVNALSALAKVRASASSSNNVLAKSSLEIIDGATSELLNVQKQVIDPLTDGLAGRTHNALVRADVAIRTVVSEGIKSSDDLGTSYSQAFAYQSGVVSKGIGGALGTVASGVGSAVSSVGTGLLAGLGIPGIIGVVVVLLVLAAVYIPRVRA